MFSVPAEEWTYAPPSLPLVVLHVDRDLRSWREARS